MSRALSLLLAYALLAPFLATPLRAEVNKDRFFDCVRSYRKVAKREIRAARWFDGRLRWNLRGQGLNYDPLADTIGQVKNDEVRQLLTEYMGAPTKQEFPVPAGIVDGLRLKLFEHTLTSLGRTPTGYAAWATRASPDEIETVKRELTPIGRMVYDSPAYRKALLTLMNNLEPDEAKLVLRKFFKDPEDMSPLRVEHNTNLLLVLGQLGVIREDVLAMSARMKAPEGKALTDEEKVERFKDELQWHLARRFASGGGIKIFESKANILEPGTKGAVFEHFLAITRKNDLLKGNLGRVDVKIQGLEGKYHNKEEINGDMTIDDGKTYTLIEAKAIQGAFNTKQKKQLENYAELMRNDVLINESGVYNSEDHYNELKPKRLATARRARKNRDERIAAVENEKPVKPIGHVIYIFSNLKAAKNNRNDIAEALTLNRKKRWKIYYVDPDTDKLEEVF